MPDCTRPESNVPSAWHASLRLRFASDLDTTRLLERAHSGPLRVQKPLYPEGPGICHAIMVHPPGGVVGGDSLSITIDAGPETHAFLTSPGAAKWYRANGKVSRQDVRINAGAGASVEWMPQEAIFFNDAHVVLDQRMQIRRGDKLVWWEQGALLGGSAAMRSPLGLNGATVCATLVGVGKPASGALIDAIRAIDPDLAISQVKSVFVARYLGNDSESARRVIVRVWQMLRPHLLGCAAPVPRIWNT